MKGSATRLGLISPLTANFCDGCNRVRLTTEGRLYSCLGHDDQVDLKAALRDVWSKIVGKPESFNAQDLVNLAFGIAQRENPEHARELDGAAREQVLGK